MTNPATEAPGPQTGFRTDNTVEILNGVLVDVPLNSNMAPTGSVVGLHRYDERGQRVAL